MAENLLESILITEGITIAELSRSTGLSQGFLSRVKSKKKSGTPVSQGKIVRGINTILKIEKYKHSDIF